LHGAAIYYDFYRPTLENNTYENNTGSAISAYPFRVLPEEIPDQQYVSGQEIVKPIKYKLVDPDLQTITTDSDSVITIAPVGSTNKVIGNTDVSVVNGIATFSDITFISKPGMKGVSYMVSSSNIDATKLRDAFNLTIETAAHTITIDFRECIVGEERVNDMCIKCPTGKYSLTAGSSECSICPKNAECMGGADIRVDHGYWRSGFDTAKIHE
jgi:hypothetical protein